MHKGNAPVCNLLSLGGRGLLLSQMTDTYRTKWPCAAAPRSKEHAASNELESRAQLASWIASGLRKSHSVRLCADGDCKDSRQTDTIPIRDSSLGQTQQQQQQVHAGATLPTRNKGSDTTEQHQEGDKTKELDDFLPLLGRTICGHEWCLYLAWHGSWTSLSFMLWAVRLLTLHQARKITDELIPSQQVQVVHPLPYSIQPRNIHFNSSNSWIYSVSRVEKYARYMLCTDHS